MSKILLFFFALLVQLSPLSVGAISSSDLKSLYYDTPYYSNSDIASSSCDGDVTLVGDDNIEKAFNFFIQKGLKPYQSAGIVGNLKAESGVTPGLHQIIAGEPRRIDDDPIPDRGYGIAQWTTPDRQDGLINYAKSKNKKPSDLDVELEYVWKELTTDYGSTLKKIKNSSTLREASDYTLIEYESPKDQSASVQSARAGLGQEILDKYGEGGGGSAGESACGDDIADANIILNKPSLKTAGKIKPTGVVLHWWSTDSGGEGIKYLYNIFRQSEGRRDCGPAGCSSQLAILQNGKTYQMTRSLTSRAIHATCANDSTIGIEIEGGPSDFGSSGPSKNPKQFEAVVATVKYLMDKYDIPLEKKYENETFTGIYSHKQVDRICQTGSKPDVDDEYYQLVIDKLKESE